VVGREKLES